MSPRQAVLVIHGMGEQRPLETLDGFVGAVVSQFAEGNRAYYSHPDRASGSFEARRYIIPPIYDEDDPDFRPQTELFEYHWSHLMTGNRIDDLAGTMRRIMLQPPWRVPGGIRGLWVVLWGAIALTVWALTVGPLSEQFDGLPGFTELVAVLVGAGAVGSLLLYVITRMLPSWITGSFVDVVRYLDTSPRSYAVRREIRSGAIEMLEELNERYDRVIVVAHSLGSYIAYDAIRFLWGEVHRTYATDPPQDPPAGGQIPAGLADAEAAGRALRDETTLADDPLAVWRAAQGALRRGLKAEGHAWHVTDLVTLGSPMYLADQIYTSSRPEFEARVARHEFPTCPPVEDVVTTRATQRVDRDPRWSWESKGRRVLHDAAPFAITRWTNLWFPSRWLFFGDWFGGPLGPLFGTGVRDVGVTSGNRRRLIPGYAHAWYFTAIQRHPDQELARAFHAALTLRFARASERP